MLNCRAARNHLHAFCMFGAGPFCFGGCLSQGCVAHLFQDGQVCFDSISWCSAWIQLHCLCIKNKLQKCDGVKGEGEVAHVTTATAQLFHKRERHKQCQKKKTELSTAEIEDAIFHFSFCCLSLLSNASSLGHLFNSQTLQRFHCLFCCLVDC